MKKRNRRGVFFAGIAMTFMMPQVAYADSSWCWISETRPYDVLPFVAVGTVVIEVLMIYWLGRVKGIASTAAVVVLSNLLSFFAPYVLGMIDPVYSGSEVWDHIPFYTVGAYYLLLTLAAETPVVYCVLKNKTENSKRLLAVILAANVVTTVMVAVVERTICEGFWA